MNTTRILLYGQLSSDVEIFKVVIEIKEVSYLH